MATPEKSKEHPNLRILPFPKKCRVSVEFLRYETSSEKELSSEGVFARDAAEPVDLQAYPAAVI